MALVPAYYVRPLLGHAKVHHHKNVVDLLGHFLVSDPEDDAFCWGGIMMQCRDFSLAWEANKSEECNLTGNRQKTRKNAGLEDQKILPIADMLSQILDALVECDAKGLRHRDLKPQNILWHGKVGCTRLSTSALLDNRMRT